MAAAGLGVSLVAFVILALLGSSNQSLATFAAAWHALGGAGIWILIYVQLHQGRLVEQERLDLAELNRERRDRLGGAGTIFKEEDAEQMDALATGRRLRSIEKWFIPVFAGIVATFLLVLGVRFLPDIWPLRMLVERGESPISNASIMAFVAGGFAFVTFALSRYAIGMSRIPGAGAWAPLRAGGAYLFGVSVANLVLAVTLILVHNGYDWPDVRVAQAIGVVMIGLAIEIGINFVLDLYRPRVAGQMQRAFYESRFLGVFSEPEGIIRSVAHTIDYQFGFKVSETWFYQFLQQKVVMLLLFQVGVIYLMTCFVVVPQGHKAVVERLVAPSARWVVDAGIHFTWPWPLARATLIPTDRVQRMELGFDRAAEKRQADAKKEDPHAPILWTQRHRVKEYRLLVADRSASADAKVPVNLLSVTMPVHWRVKADRVLSYFEQAGDVEAIVEGLAYREMTKYAAHADLLDLMGRGGIQAVDAIRNGLQAACDHAGANGTDLGVEIVMVGLGGVHPPVEVAEAYENVINALEQKDTKIKEGLKDAAKTQINAAGEGYRDVYDAITAEDKARGENAPDADAKAARVEQLLRERIGGAAREQVALAEEYLYRRITLEGATAELFRIQRVAYEQSPAVFRLRAYLKMLSESLTGVRKYIVALRNTERVFYNVDLKPPPPIELLQQEVQSFSEGGGR